VPHAFKDLRDHFVLHAQFPDPARRRKIREAPYDVPRQGRTEALDVQRVGCREKSLTH
jgi:hypothetical protein